MVMPNETNNTDPAPAEGAAADTNPASTVAPADAASPTDAAAAAAGEAGAGDAPVAEVANPSTEATGSGEDSGSSASSDAPPPKQAKAQKPRDWRDDRIDKLAGQRNELQERLARAEAQLAKLQPNESGAVAPAAPAAPAADAIQAAAAELLAKREFEASCNKTFEAGVAAYPDFSEHVQDLQRVVERFNPKDVQQYNILLEAAMATGEGPRILYALGGNPNKARELLDKPAHVLGIELAKMAADKNNAPPPTNAPKPVTPIGSRGVTSNEIDPSDASRADKLSMAEWMARRTKQVTERGLKQ